MTSQCRQEQKCLKDVVKRNVRVNEPQKLNHYIYYKNLTCSQERCQPIPTYIGYTTTTIKQRMTTHMQNGSIAIHSIQEHGIRIRTADIMKGINILYRSNEKMNLVYAEALLIKHEQPRINSHREGEYRILKVF